MLFIRYSYMLMNFMPTYRLKYLPKNDVLAKLSELEISWMGILVDFSCDLASIITMCEMISDTGVSCHFLYSSTEVNI